MQNPLPRHLRAAGRSHASEGEIPVPKTTGGSRCVAPRGVIGILGFGVDGKCVAEFLQRCPEVRGVRVFDDADVRFQISDIRCQRGKSLDGVDILFRSPGFPLTHPIVLEAKRRDIPITSSTTYFLQHFSGTIVGITGSNGKTTCTALIAAMLRAQFGKERVEEGGNDRKPRLDLLNSQFPIPNSQSISNSQFSIPNYAVLELSSFQLIDCPVSPHVAVVLNLTPNHLDWHANMEEYVEAKQHIVSGKRPFDAAQDRQAASGQHPVAVLNERDPIVCMFADGLDNVDVHWFGGCPLPTAHCSFLTHPDTIRAAVTAARVLGVSDTNIVSVLERFRGIPQRLEFVRELNGVRWYNDSSCTTPESAITACESFPEGTVVLLLGGRDKGMDFSKLYEVIKERNVRVVPYGEMAPRFVQALPRKSQIPNPKPQDFEATMNVAKRSAKPGDNIVLSPACASFDMFANAKERGRIFEKGTGVFFNAQHLSSDALGGGGSTPDPIVSRFVCSKLRSRTADHA